jgi:hypothetical protein
VVRRVAGNGDHVELDTGELELLAAAQLRVDLVGLHRVPAEPVGALLRHRVARGRVDGRAGPLAEIVHGADVVDVRVGDEDRRTARSHPSQLKTQRGRVVAGVDDDRVGRATLGAHHVAIRARDSELVAVDDERHGQSSVVRG